MTKHGHGLPRKRPGLDAKHEIADELPELEPLADELPQLEPIEELPTLEAIEPDGPVRITRTTGSDGEPGFDTTLSIEVQQMDKKDVADAVRGPLARAVTAAAAELRHRRVLVRFTGEAMIGSAVKELVTETLKAHKPLAAVVRRGFGDETVLQGALPQVAITSKDDAGTTRIDIDTGELEPEDLRAALASHLAQWTANGKGKRYAFAFRGKAKLDAKLRSELTTTLRDAGAVRAAIGERVLFDRELEDRVRCEVTGDTATLRITPAADDAATIDALLMVLPSHKDALRGKVVALEFVGSTPATARDFCLEFAQKHGASRVLLRGVGEPAVLWPPVLSVTTGSEITLRVDGIGRSRAAILAGVRAEASAHSVATRAQAVVLDWPAGFVLDGEAEAAVAEVAAACGAKSIACTIGGEHREPFVPSPVTLTIDGGRLLLRLDSESGKPVELQRAIDRRFTPRVGELRGKAVCVQIVGSAALSRTLLRAVLSSVESAGATRLELAEHDTTDVLLPPLLSIARSAGVVRIAARGEGRNEEQQARALKRELDVAALPAGSTIHVGATSMADAVVAAVIANGAGRVVLDGPAPVLVHPPMLGRPEKKGLSLRLAVQAAGDAAMAARQLDRELAGCLDACGPMANTTVTIVWPGINATSAPMTRLIEAFAAKKVTKVLLDAGDGKPTQVHPPVAAPTATPAATPAAPRAAAPAASAATGASLISLLGRRDEAVPPMILLGVEAGTDAGHLAAVEAQLQEHLPRFRGRAVLLVPRRGAEDVPVRKADELLDALRRLVPTTAAATLVFRGPDAQGRPHFQVLHSTIRAMPVGGVFADPRTRS